MTESRQFTVSEHLAHYEDLVQRLERERDEYAEAAHTLLRIYDLHVDQRLQGYSQNIALIDPIRLILGLKPCWLGRTDFEFEVAQAQFDAVRAEHVGGDER